MGRVKIVYIYIWKLEIDDERVSFGDFVESVYRYSIFVVLRCYGGLWLREL